MSNHFFTKSNAFLCAASVLSCAVFSCQKNIDEPPVPFFKVDTEEIAIGPEGGAFDIYYTVEHPVHGVEINVVCHDDWVSVADTTAEGIIKMYAESNPDSCARSSIVSMEYYGNEYDVIVVQQAEGQPPVEQETFAFIINDDDIAETSVTFSIIPADKEMTYIGMLNEKEYMDGFATDEDYFKDDFDFFRDMATMTYGVSVEEYLSMILKCGDTVDEYVNMLDPDTGYYVYAYGMTADCAYLTDLYKQEFRTLPVEMNGMTFEIECVPDKNTAELHVIPSDPGQYYFYSFYKQSEVGKDEIYEQYQEFVTTMIQIYIQQYGITPEQFIEEAASVGEERSVLEDLSDYTDYYAFAASVATCGILNTDVTVEEFTTGRKYSSDNVLLLSLSNATEHTVNYEIKASNDDPYVMFTDEYSNWAEYYEYYDAGERIQEAILSGNYDLESMVRRGSEKGIIDDLTGKTEYVVFLFGYDGTDATTELYDGNFVTTGPVSEVSVCLEYDKYFDGTELEAIDPLAFAGASGKAVIPVKAVVTGDADGYYYHIFEGDCTDTSIITDEIAINTMRFFGVTSETHAYIVDYDEVNTFMGVAYDSENNYGPIWRETFTLDREGVSPVEEYEW